MPWGTLDFRWKILGAINKIILQADYQSDSSTRVQLTNPYSESIQIFFPLFQHSREFEQALLERSISTQVQDIFGEDETYYSFAQQVVDTVPFYGNLTNGIGWMITHTISMEDVLREYVRGVWVSKHPKALDFECQINRTINYLKTTPDSIRWAAHF